jgi:protein involved in plasmid replication-relaxation
MNESLVAVTPSVTRALLRVTREANNDATPDLISGGTSLPRNVHARAHAALGLLAGFRALRRAQLEAFLFTDDRLRPASRRVVAQRVLGHLRERGLVQGVASAGAAGTEGSRAYVLTAAGQRLYAAGDPTYPARRIRAPSTLLLEHAVALADIAIAFRDAALRAGDTDLWWESDWAALRRIGSTGVIPDALVTLERRGWRTRAFIEADRATERETAFARKLHRYIDLYRADDWRASFGAWPLILTVTTSDAHARVLCRLAHRVTLREGGSRIERAFRFASLAELRVAGPLAPIWHVAGSVDREPIAEPTFEDGDHGAGDRRA